MLLITNFNLQISFSIYFIVYLYSLAYYFLIKNYCLIFIVPFSVFSFLRNYYQQNFNYSCKNLYNFKSLK